MIVVTSQELADTAKDRWYQFHKKEIEFGPAKPSYSPINKRDVYERLCSLENVNPNTVNDAIGNTSWTSINCDQCGEDCDKAVLMEGSEWDMSYCIDCIRAAMAELEK